MKRSVLIAACLLSFAGHAFAQAVDTPPTTPGNPTARAYGPTSGGVAWQRSTDDRRVVGYEITRDGTVLGVRDTLSYVVDDLQPGRGYNIAVVAIDSAGQRSGRALARIETPDARPNRPTGLAANVYSSTAAGITWERSGVFGERYEVKRDGEIVAAATNGTSYIDTTLSPARPLYLYEVIAVNRQGQRSAAARLFVRTAGGSTPPPVSAPAAPGGLRSVLYSSTAGAIAWERASTAGLRYEIRRDGEIVATTDGTSYIDSTLEDGRTYTYSVIALDGARRSGASTVTLATAGNGGGNTDPSRPAAPTRVDLEPVPDKTFRISWQPSEGAEFYRVLENPNGTSGFMLISGDLDESTQRFDHRVALYARADARYVVQACNANGCSDSEALIVSGSLERAIGYFKASNSVRRNNFGRAVSLSADGNTMAIGATYEESAAFGNEDNEDDQVTAPGVVFIFTRIDGAWQQQAYVKASNADQADGFGEAVSLSADGSVLAIGAGDEDSAATGVDGDQDDDSADGSGAVYVFGRSGDMWQQQAYLKAGNTVQLDNGRGDNFGRAVSLSADGDTLVVGAENEDSAATGVNGEQNDESAPNSGAAYTFTRINETWQQQAYIKADERAVRFGGAVSLSGDGKTLAIGASGAYYVFTLDDGNWQQQTKLDASNGVRTATSLSADGDVLAFAEILEGIAAIEVTGDPDVDETGSVRVYERSDGNWQEQAYLKPVDTDGDLFGAAVSLGADGNTLAISARRDDSAATGLNGDQSDTTSFSSGAVYVFARESGTWFQQAYLKPGNTDQGITGFAEAFTSDLEDFGPDNFGFAVSLSADGATLAVGANGENSAATGVGGEQDDESAFDAGAVYLY